MRDVVLFKTSSGVLTTGYSGVVESSVGDEMISSGSALLSGVPSGTASPASPQAMPATTLPGDLTHDALTEERIGGVSDRLPEKPALPPVSSSQPSPVAAPEKPELPPVSAPVTTPEKPEIPELPPISAPLPSPVAAPEKPELPPVSAPLPSPVATQEKPEIPGTTAEVSTDKLHPPTVIATPVKIETSTPADSDTHGGGSWQDFADQMSENWVYEDPVIEKYYEGTEGNDVASGKHSESKTMLSVNLYGGNDQYTGTDAAERIDAGEGNDLVSTGGGGDVVALGGGDDKVTLLGGESMLDGGDGLDTIDLSFMKDNITLQIGGDSGGLVSYGDTKIDIYSFENVMTGAGDDEIIDKGGQESAGSLFVTGDGNDVVEAGGAGDVIFGGEGDDVLKGDSQLKGDLGDVINGGEGDDRIYGSGANDTIDGGLGIDRINGAGGNDVFVFDDTAKSSPSDPDAIVDFNEGDKLDLRALHYSKADIRLDLSSGGLFINSTDSQFSVFLEGVESINADQLMLS